MPLALAAARAFDYSLGRSLLLFDFLFFGKLKSDISNEVGRCQEFSSSFFEFLHLFCESLHLFLLDQAHPWACAGASLRWTDLLPSSISALCPPYALSPVTSSLGCCPPNISSILTDHDELFELPGYPRRAGRLINRTVTVRTIRDVKHPRTGCTTVVLLSATTELFVVNLVPQHDPQSDPELAGYASSNRT